MTAGSGCDARGCAGAETVGLLTGGAAVRAGAGAAGDCAATVAMETSANEAKATAIHLVAGVPRFMKLPQKPRCRRRAHGYGGPRVSAKRLTNPACHQAK